jgi:MFS family permease
VGEAAPVDATAFRRALAGSMAGAVLEWYEFSVYGALAGTVFAQQFFPSAVSHTALLLAFGTQAVGFVARPVGGVVFGHLGDKIGRKPMLVATYITLAIATAGIGLLPTYATWGLAAPILLIALRFVQGFALGGEFGAAVTLVLEYAPADQRGRWTAFPQAGGPAGTILATGVLGLLGASMSSQAFASWGWRVAFLLAVPLLLVGAWIRRGVEESPAFRHAVATRGARPRSSVLEALEHPVPILQGLGVRIAENVAFYIYNVFVIAYATRTLGFSSAGVLRAVWIAAVCQFFAMLIGGRLSDVVGRKPIMMVAAIGLALWAPGFFALASTSASRGSLALLSLAICVAATLHGLLAGPEAAWIAELFPTRYRSAGGSLAFQGSSIVAGGPAPLIATALMAGGHDTTGVTIYLIICALISVLALLSGPETKGLPADA